MLDNYNNDEKLLEDIIESEASEPGREDNKTKPHIIRRNIEDYLAQRALEKRLKDVFDEDFLLD